MFTDRNITGNLSIDEVFMPLIFGALKYIQADTVGLIYEYMSEAGRMAVNGNPSFLSMRVLNKEDAVTFAGYVNKLLAAQRAAVDALEDDDETPSV